MSTHIILVYRVKNLALNLIFQGIMIRDIHISIVPQMQERSEVKRRVTTGPAESTKFTESYKQFLISFARDFHLRRFPIGDFNLNEIGM